LKFANKLKSAGVLPEHAEAEAEALADIFEVNLKEVATREDIKHLEERIDSKFIQLEQRMTIKLGALIVITVGAVAAADHDYQVHLLCDSGSGLLSGGHLLTDGVEDPKLSIAKPAKVGNSFP